MRLVDDPAQPPYLAGSIWTSLKSSDKLKKFATSDFGVKCEATKSSVNDDFFGTCKVLIKSESLVDVTGNSIGFLKRDQKANEFQSGFNNPANGELIFKDEKFSLNLDFKYSLVTFEMLKSEIKN